MYALLVLLLMSLPTDHANAPMVRDHMTANQDAASVAVAGPEARDTRVPAALDECSNVKDVVALINDATSSAEKTMANLGTLLAQAQEGGTPIDRRIVGLEDSFHWYDISGAFTQGDLLLGKISDAIRSVPASNAKQSALDALVDLARATLAAHEPKLSPSHALNAAFYAAVIPDSAVMLPDALNVEELLSVMTAALDDERKAVRDTAKWLLCWVAYVQMEKRPEIYTVLTSKCGEDHYEEIVARLQRTYGRPISFDEFAQMVNQPPAELLQTIGSGHADAYLLNRFAATLRSAPNRAELIKEFLCSYPDTARFHAGVLAAGPIGEDADDVQKGYVVDLIKVIDSGLQTTDSTMHMSDYAPRLLRTIGTYYSNRAEIKYLVKSGSEIERPFGAAMAMRALCEAMKRDDWAELQASAARELAVLSWLSEEFAAQAYESLVDAENRIKSLPHYGPQELGVFTGEVPLGDKYRGDINGAANEALEALNAWKARNATS